MPHLMDTQHIRLCHVIWYGGFARDGHPIYEPVVHAVRGLSVMDIAELIVHGKIEHSTTNFVVVSAAIPPSKEIFTTRSLGALRTSTSSWRPFGPLNFVLRALRALRPCDPRVGDWIAC